METQMAALSGFAKRFQVLVYDHPWQMYPFIIGMMFFVLSTVDWATHILFGWNSNPFLERVAFSAILAGIMQYKSRRREARDRLV